MYISGGGGARDLVMPPQPRPPGGPCQGLAVVPACFKVSLNVKSQQVLTFVMTLNWLSQTL